MATKHQKHIRRERERTSFYSCMKCPNINAISRGFGERHPLAVKCSACGATVMRDSIRRRHELAQQFGVKATRRAVAQFKAVHE